MKHKTCIFCRMISGEITTNLITQNNDAIIIQDINPKADVHWLVIPRRHFVDMRVLSSLDSPLLGSLMLLSITAIREYANNAAFRIIVNNGSEVGQHVFHSHIHLLAGHLYDNHSRQ
jgi:histidine triad (HIT) family protein